MAFVSYEFGVFLILSLILYGICMSLAPSASMRTVMLAGISVVFLWLAGGWRSLVFYGISAVSVWAAARSIQRRRTEGLSGEKRIYGLAVCLNLGLLALFQYVNFPGYTAQEVAWLAGSSWEWTPVELIAPAAVSFYTLTLIGYLTDVYWESQEAEKSFLRVALFGGFFPQMAMGPIARYDRLGSTLFGFRKPDPSDLTAGGWLILWGLFKKLVISERLAVIVNTIYGDYEYYSGSFLILAAVCFGFQLYTDFGGAIDIASGVARLFGVRLEQNFRQPFYSRSIAEFWRRWHMTLGGWFKDYVMYPLLKSASFQKAGRWGKERFGKKQGKKIPVVCGLFVVWFLLGLWHGGKWTFIIGSGLYHAFLMSLSTLTEPWTDRLCDRLHLNREHPLWVGFQRVRTFVLVSVGFVFFRSDSLAMAAGIFGGMASGNMELFTMEGLLSAGLSVPDLFVLLVSMMVLWADSARKERAEQGTGISDTGRTAGGRAWALCLTMAFVILLFGYYGQGYDPSAFIYAQF